MFTGLIETIGTIAAIKRGDRSATITIEPALKHFDVRIGDSVAINGVCLTVVAINGRKLEFNAISETLDRSSLSHKSNGSIVNMERALPASGRLDGHIVQGHVDGTGTMIRDERSGDSIYRWIKFPPELAPLLAEKGSVAIDGISLTIAKSTDSEIAVALIPHTIASTTMRDVKAGDIVNIECDVLARYIFRMLKYSGQPENNGPDLLSLMESSGF